MRPLGKFQGLELYLTVVDDLSTWSPNLSRMPPFTAFCALADSATPLEAFAEQLISGSLQGRRVVGGRVLTRSTS